MTTPVIQCFGRNFSVETEDLKHIPEPDLIEQRALAFQMDEAEAYQKRETKRRMILHAVNSHAELVRVLRQFVQDHIRAKPEERYAHATSFLRAQAALKKEVSA